MIIPPQGWCSACSHCFSVLFSKYNQDILMNLSSSIQPNFCLQNNKKTKVSFLRAHIRHSLITADKCVLGSFTSFLSSCEVCTDLPRNKFLVSKETVVLRRWERSKQKLGFIKRVDIKVKLPPWKIWKERNSLQEIASLFIRKKKQFWKCHTTSNVVVTSRQCRYRNQAFLHCALISLLRLFLNASFSPVKCSP